MLNGSPELFRSPYEAHADVTLPEAQSAIEAVLSYASMKSGHLPSEKFIRILAPSFPDRLYGSTILSALRKMSAQGWLIQVHTTTMSEEFDEADESFRIFKSKRPDGADIAFLTAGSVSSRYTEKSSNHVIGRTYLDNSALVKVLNERFDEALPRDPKAGASDRHDAKPACTD